MHYITHYSSPLGEMLLSGDGEGLTGLWFEGQKHFARGLDGSREEREDPLFGTAKRWLDVYFSGREPDFSVPLRLTGTAFQREVWALLRDIPYGHTATYGELAAALAARRGVPRVSARAVGSAVGRNPVSVIVPCHRVVGADGGLTGYAGGLERKARLLALERADPRRHPLPGRETAP